MWESLGCCPVCATPVFTARGCVMVAPGAKGFFPSSSDEATKPTSIIPLSNPHTRTTGFQGTRISMAEPPRTKSGLRLTAIVLPKTPNSFREHLVHRNESLHSLRNSSKRKGITIFICEGLLTACWAGENLSTKSASSIRVKSGVFSWKAQTLALSG